jgi:hypothetical protein
MLNKLSSTLVLACALSAGSALATTINFDDLPGSATIIQSPYEGLNWDNFSAGNLGGILPDSGYPNGTVSPNNIALNRFGAPASISLGGQGTFDLNSAFLTGAWNDGLNVNVVGFLDGVSVYNNTYTVSAYAPTLVTFDYLGVDSVTFSSYGGDHVFLEGSGSQFVMDDLVINQSVAVPDAGSTATLLGMVLLGFGVLRRKLS